MIFKAHQVLHQLRKGRERKKRLASLEVPALFPSWQRFRGKDIKDKKINLRSLEVPALLPAEQRLRGKTLVRERNHHHPPRSQHPRSLCIYIHIYSFPVILHIIWYLIIVKIVKITKKLTIIVNSVIN